MTKQSHGLRAVLIVVALLVFCASSRAQSDSGREAHIATLRTALAAGVTDLDAQLAKPDATITTRDLSNGALAKLLLTGDAAGADLLLRREIALQNHDANAPDAGNLPWDTSGDISDKNAVEFGTQAWGPIWLEFGARLSPETRALLHTAARDVIPAVQRHQVPVTYTNIFLMKTINLMCLGQIVDDEDTIEAGRKMLDEWIAWTKLNGIREFDSPTYYGVDLNSLSLGALYAPDAPTRARFKGVLDLFWNDTAANFLPSTQTMTGPLSRSYDFLKAGGGLETYLFAMGWKTMRKMDKIDLEKSHLLLAMIKDAYRPSPETRRIADLPQRLVLQKWDPTPGAERINFLTPSFAIGSTSANYGPQDKLMTIDLASSKGLPTISIVPDVFDAPYGQVKIKGRDGHSKPQHLPLNPTIAQHEGSVLALLDLDASRAREISSLATNILLPAKADAISVDGQPVTLSAGLKMPLSAASVVGVREGQTGVAMRIFHADGANGQSAQWLLQADKDGLKSGAARLTTYHFRSDAPDKPRALSEKHLRVGVLIVAASCPTSVAFDALVQRVRTAQIKATSDEKIYDVKATMGDLTLEAARDLEHRLPLRRLVNGQEMQFETLSLNGNSLWPETLVPRPAN